CVIVMLHGLPGAGTLTVSEEANAATGPAKPTPSMTPPTKTSLLMRRWVAELITRYIPSQVPNRTAQLSSPRPGRLVVTGGFSLSRGGPVGTRTAVEHGRTHTRALVHVGGATIDNDARQVSDAKGRTRS